MCYERSLSCWKLTRLALLRVGFCLARCLVDNSDQCTLLVWHCTLSCRIISPLVLTRPHCVPWRSLINSHRPLLKVTTLYLATSRTKNITCDIRKLLAFGLALIGASSPDAKTVTACFVEVTYPEGSNDPVVILRMAQNKPVDEREKLNLQSLVDDLVTNVSAKDKSVWNKKDGAFSFISLRRQDMIVSVTRLIYHHPGYRPERSSATYSNAMQREDISYFHGALFSAFS
jgi:hypothetical protein